MKQSLLLTVQLCGVLFGGCGRMTPRNYLTSLSAAEVADAAADGLAEEFRTADADYLSDYVTLPQSGYTLCVRIATGGDCIDEYGILHTDIDTEGAERLIREYLAPLLRGEPRVLRFLYFPPRRPSCAMHRYGSMVTMSSTPSFPRRTAIACSTVSRRAFRNNRTGLSLRG